MASVGSGAVEDNPPVVAESVEDPQGGDPALILPEEMWCKIFEYLKDDPRDILNVSETCTHFHDLIQRDNDLSGRRLEEAIPLVLQWLDRDDILTCRGITKRVRKAVDKVLSNKYFVNSREKVGLFPRLIPQKSSPERIGSFEWRHFFRVPDIDTGLITSVETIEELARDFEQRRISTLVTNSLHLVVSERPSMIRGELLDRYVFSLNSLRDLVEQLLLFDSHNETIDDPNLMYDIIRKFVSVLPNLRGLDRLAFPGLSSNVEVGAPTLERHIANGHPLPDAPLLERLRIDEFDLPGPLFREIVRRYSGHLKELDVWLLENISEVDVLRLWREEYRFPQLRSLELYDFTWRWQPILAKLRADKLEYLYLSILVPQTPPSPVPSVTQLIQVLQQIPSISKLRLQVKLNRYGDISENHRAVLVELDGERHANLKELQLEESWYNIPLQFFARLFPTLESVRIYGYSWTTIFRNRQSDPELNLCFQRRFQESTLWNLLPKLQKFEIYAYHRAVDRYVCTRADAVESQNRHD